MPFASLTVGDPGYYESVLVKALGSDFSTFTIEKKADAKYKVVSAASIVAKVTRDSLLCLWDDALRLSPPEGSLKRKFEVGVGEEVEDEKAVECLPSPDLIFGSGYPGDPKCVEW
jgi:hypothetical protein